MTRKSAEPNHADKVQVRAIARALGHALMATMQAANEPTVGTIRAMDKSWDTLADKVIKFAESD